MTARQPIPIFAPEHKKEHMPHTRNEQQHPAKHANGNANDHGHDNGTGHRHDHGNGRSSNHRNHGSANGTANAIANTNGRSSNRSSAIVSGKSKGKGTVAAAAPTAIAAVIAAVVLFACVTLSQPNAFGTISALQDYDEEQSAAVANSPQNNAGEWADPNENATPAQRTPANYTENPVEMFQYQLGLNAGCEAVSLAIALNMLGVEADPYDIVDNYLEYGSDYASTYVGDPYWSGGALPPAIRKAANMYLTMHASTFKAYDLTGYSREDILAALDDGYPILLWVTDDMGYPYFDLYDYYYDYGYGYDGYNYGYDGYGDRYEYWGEGEGGYNPGLENDGIYEPGASQDGGIGEDSGDAIDSQEGQQQEVTQVSFGGYGFSEPGVLDEGNESRQGNGASAAEGEGDGSGGNGYAAEGQNAPGQNAPGQGEGNPQGDGASNGRNTNAAKNTWYFNEHCVVIYGYDAQAGIAYLSDPINGLSATSLDWLFEIYEACGSMALGIW